MRWMVLVALVAGNAMAQPLRQPQGVAFSPDGTKLAISDTGNGRVLVLRGKGARRNNGVTEWRLQAVIDGVHEPHGLAWLDEQRLAVCEAGKKCVTVFRFHSRGRVSRERSLTGLQRPTGVAVWRDLFFVTDADKHQAIAFRSNGQQLTSFGAEGDGKGTLRHPMDIAVADDGTVFIADEGNGRVAIWHYDAAAEKAEPNEPYSLNGFWTCRSVTIVNPVSSSSRHPATSELWVLSSHSGELKRTALTELEKPQWRIFTGFLEGTQREVTAVHSGHRMPDGKPSRHSIFTEGQVPFVLALGRIGTPLSPAADFDVSPQANLLAIAKGDRVLFLPLNSQPHTPHPAPILPTRPQISATQTDAVVTWETPFPTETVVEMSLMSNGKWRRIIVPGKRTHHRVLIRDLRPATTYRLRVPLYGCWEIADPSSPTPNPPSFEFAFATQPPKGVTSFLRIPIAVLVYADVVNVDTLTPDAPPAPPVDRAYLDYLRREVEMAQLFYWCNSQMKLWLDCDWFVITKRITVGKDQPPQKDWRQDLEALLKFRGKSLSDYPSVVEITCERRWNEKTKRYEFAPSGGGTYGADMHPGSSHFLGGHDTAWLFVHEFHHQLDSQFAESGYPEYPFNHFSITPEGFADNFGEHYDGNAWILRNWHGGDLGLWFVNKFGKLVTATDTDDDDIPDDCPAVPLDEKRFKSDPTKSDTDYDGLSDMDEVLASSWVFELLPCDTNARARYLLPDPCNPDTDGDGVLDGQDLLPLYVCEHVIRRDGGRGTRDEGRRWFWVDEDLTVVPTPYEVTRPVRPLHGDIFLSHDGEWLRFGFAFNEPVPLVHVQLDCNANGYWVGADNLDVRVRVDWEKQEASLEVTVNNASSRERWSFPDKTLMLTENVRVTVRKAALRYELVVAIKGTEAIGLTLQSGERIGLAIYLLAAPNSDRWLSVFEPYRLIPLVVE